MFSTARPRRMTDEGEDRGSAVRQEEIPPEASQARDRGSEEEQGEASLEGAMETSKAVACRSPLVTVSSPIHSSVYHKAEKLTFRVWCFGFCVFVGFFKAEWHFIFKRKTVYSSICCNFDRSGFLRTFSQFHGGCGLSSTSVYWQGWKSEFDLAAPDRLGERTEAPPGDGAGKTSDIPAESSRETEPQLPGSGAPDPHSHPRNSKASEPPAVLCPSPAVGQHKAT